MKSLYAKIITVLMCAGLPVAGFSAGTYYSGSYQSPQRNYSTTNYTQQRYAPVGTAKYNTPSYNQSSYNPYNAYTPYNASTQQMQQTQRTAATNSSATAKGLTLNGHLGYESSMWQFSMAQAGSILTYNNVDWLTFNLGGDYKFGNDIPMEINAGLTIGTQASETYMTDDDITNGGYLVAEWYKSDNSLLGQQIGHAMSIGTSSGGSMLGFHAGLGLTDYFTMGKMKITPSIGYRHHSYTLETAGNYGMSVDTAACFETADGEIQCDPTVIITTSTGDLYILWRDNTDDNLLTPNSTNELPSGISIAGISTGGTYYYEQGGTSHSYDVAWSGPYLAMDGRYDINNDNFVNARVELGLPSYSAIGDQPYRFDWAHPKSVEDSAGIGSAIHFAFGADYNTRISDSVMLTIGLNYDNYSVSGGSATTYLNEGFYTGIYSELQAWWIDPSYGKQANLDNFLPANWADASWAPDSTIDPALQAVQAEAVAIKRLEAADWQISTENEIESFYKSIGMRVGFRAAF